MTDARAAADSWHGRSVEDWRIDWGVPLLRIHDRVGSTNDVARTLAEQGAPAGTVVLADEQTRGRGRRGRAWSSAPGQSLLMSTVLRPAPGPADAALPLRLGLAAARAIEGCTPLRVRLKWPNDLLVDGRKVGGILVEGAHAGGRPLFLIAGFGINVRQRPEDWPPHLAHTATSIAAAGADIEVAELAGRVVAELRAVAARGTRPLTADELDDLARRDALMGRAVAVDDSPAGIAAGIAPDGRLVVERDGQRHRVVAGTVRTLEHGSGAP